MTTPAGTPTPRTDEGIVKIQLPDPYDERGGIWLSLEDSKKLKAAGMVLVPIGKESFEFGVDEGLLRALGIITSAPDQTAIGCAKAIHAEMERRKLK